MVKFINYLRHRFVVVSVVKANNNFEVLCICIFYLGIIKNTWYFWWWKYIWQWSTQTNKSGSQLYMPIIWEKISVHRRGIKMYIISNLQYMMTSSNGKMFRVTGSLCEGIHRSPVNSPHKGQWRGTLMFSLICAWINAWVNNREAGDLGLHRIQ